MSKIKTAVKEVTKGTIATAAGAFAVVATELLRAGEYLYACACGAVSIGLFAVFAYLVEKQAQG